MIGVQSFETETLRSWRESPKRFVYDNFKVDPDPWQSEALEQLLDQNKKRLALVACA